jgi:hypothetical protein
LHVSQLAGINGEVHDLGISLKTGLPVLAEFCAIGHLFSRGRVSTRLSRSTLSSQPKGSLQAAPAENFIAEMTWLSG